MRRSATEQPDVTMTPAGPPVTHGPTGTTRSGKKCRPTMRGQGPTPCPSCDAVCLQGQHVPPGTNGRYYARCVEAKGEVDFAMGEAMRLLRDWKSNTNPRVSEMHAKTLDHYIQALKRLTTEWGEALNRACAKIFQEQRSLPGFAKQFERGAKPHDAAPFEGRLRIAHGLSMCLKGFDTLPQRLCRF